MKRFAANRIYSVPDMEMYRNQVVEIDDTTHKVIRTFRLDEEICHTEWKGGIILLAAVCPRRNAGEDFAAFLQRISNVECYSVMDTLYAYHITAFDVNSMEFTVESRIISL